MQIVKFKEWECIVQLGEYSNKRTAIQLNDIKTGLPVAVSTVNMPAVELEKFDVLIKNYSENEGMKEALMEAGVISEEIYSHKKMSKIRLDISLHRLL